MKVHNFTGSFGGRTIARLSFESSINRWAVWADASDGPAAYLASFADKGRAEQYRDDAQVNFDRLFKARKRKR